MSGTLAGAATGALIIATSGRSFHSPTPFELALATAPLVLVVVIPAMVLWNDPL